MATTPEGIDYIRQQLTLGVTSAQITAALTKGGWHADDIAQSITAVESVVPPAPSPVPPPLFAPVSTPVATQGITPVSAPVQPLQSAPDPVVVPQTVVMPVQTPISIPVTPVTPVTPVIIANPISMPTIDPIVSVPIATTVSVNTSSGTMGTVASVDNDLDVGLPATRVMNLISPETPHITVPPVSAPAPLVRERHPFRVFVWILVMLILFALGALSVYAYATGRLPFIEQYVVQYLPFLSHAS